MNFKFIPKRFYIITCAMLAPLCMVTGEEERVKKSEDVANALVISVKFQDFFLHVYPAYDLAKEGYSFSEATLDEPGPDLDRKAEFFCTWVAKDYSVISIRNHLLFIGLGNSELRNFEIPNQCQDIWLINDTLLCPECGIIKESNITPELASLLDANRNDCAYSHDGVTYIAKDSLVQNCTLKNSKDGYLLFVGDRFFKISGDSLNYSGEKYNIKKGDVVTVNRQGDLKIDR